MYCSRAYWPTDYITTHVITNSALFYNKVLKFEMIYFLIISHFKFYKADYTKTSYPYPAETKSDQLSV